MGYAQEQASRNFAKKSTRSAYDRRAGNDRRSFASQEDYDGIEKRDNPERRMIIKEKRLGWVRDTKWSSINLDLLR